MLFTSYYKMLCSETDLCHSLTKFNSGCSLSYLISILCPMEIFIFISLNLVSGIKFSSHLLDFGCLSSSLHDTPGPNIPHFLFFYLYYIFILYYIFFIGYMCITFKDLRDLLIVILSILIGSFFESWVFL